MKAIILAAGLGNRLLPLTEDKPKCLIEFSGKTLLDRLLKTFKSCGVNDIVLVIGHKNEKIKNVIKSTNFDNLKNMENKSGFSEKSENSDFFRSGKTKQWKNELNQKQKNLIEQSFKKQMIELGYI